MTAGRYAPSPSGDLHIGNLRTALLAWLFARHSGKSFALRVEDLDDRCRPEFESRQIDDLAALGLDFDGPILRQSDRLDAYRDAVSALWDRGLTYECFCTRREIRQASRAPHAPPGAYPGTCRELSATERGARRDERPAAIRLRSEVSDFSTLDLLHGEVAAAVDDFVLMRGGGVPAYNLAVVVDDAFQGVDQVVRADDLLSSSPRQAYLASLLGLPPVEYAHVPLVLNTAGQRLAKRDGAVTWRDLIAAGTDPWKLITDSLNLKGETPQDLLGQFDPIVLPREPWVFEPPQHD